MGSSQELKQTRPLFFIACPAWETVSLARENIPVHLPRSAFTTSAFLQDNKDDAMPFEPSDLPLSLTVTPRAQGVGDHPEIPGSHSHQIAELVEEPEAMICFSDSLHSRPMEPHV